MFIRCLCTNIAT